MNTWLLNVLVAVSQLANAVLLGDPDETLSSRVGKRHAWAARIIDRLFWFDRRHCARVREDDEGREGLNAADRRDLAVVLGLLAGGAVVWFSLATLRP
jgi:hypothetical protein